MHVGSITTFRLFQNNALAEIRAKNHSMVSTRVLPACNAVKYVFFANTVLIQIQYFLDQISVLSLSKFSIAWNRRIGKFYQALVLAPDHIIALKYARSFACSCANLRYA